MYVNPPDRGGGKFASCLASGCSSSNNDDDDRNEPQSGSEGSDADWAVLVEETSESEEEGDVSGKVDEESEQEDVSKTKRKRGLHNDVFEDVEKYRSMIDDSWEELVKQQLPRQMSSSSKTNTSRKRKKRK